MQPWQIYRGLFRRQLLRQVRDGESNQQDARRRFPSSVTELYRFATPNTVVEVGCGEGKLADPLVRSGTPPSRFVPTDLSLEQQDPDAHPTIEFVEASVYDLPFESGSFDLMQTTAVDGGLGTPSLDRYLELPNLVKPDDL